MTISRQKRGRQRGRHAVAAGGVDTVPSVTLGVCAVVTDARGRLLGHHTYRRQPWGLPGGVARGGEQPAAALARELRGEMGVAARVGTRGSLGDGWTEEAVGTLGYAAPEQLADPAEAVHPAADVYALGVVLYELATGRLPHELAPGEDEPALRARIIGGDAPNPATVYRPDLAAEIDRVLGEALAYDPTARTRNAATLGRAWAAAWRVAGVPR